MTKAFSNFPKIAVRNCYLSMSNLISYLLRTCHLKAFRCCNLFPTRCTQGLFSVLMGTRFKETKILKIGLSGVPDQK